MNSLQAAAAEAFVEILRDAGVPVTIGGKDYQAMVSPSGLAVDLEEGGFTQDGALTVRLLVAHLPIPQLAHNDTILIGGGMMFTFLKAQGLEVGSSLVEEDRIDLARQILASAAEKGVHLVLPTDTVVADRFADDATKRTVPVTGMEAGWMGGEAGSAEVVRCLLLLSARAMTARSSSISNGLRR